MLMLLDSLKSAADLLNKAKSMQCQWVVDIPFLADRTAHI